jgi:hypothetical protein
VERPWTIIEYKREIRSVFFDDYQYKRPHMDDILLEKQSLCTLNCPDNWKYLDRFPLQNIVYPRTAIGLAET